MKKKSCAGQASLEYALLLVLIAVVIIVVLTVTSTLISQRLGDVAAQLTTPTAGSTSPSVPSPNALQVFADMQSRILAYYAKYGKWPRTWSPYNFTDIGLTPSDWSQPIDGLYLSPHGGEVGIANKLNDQYQVYVEDLNGQTLHLVDGWNIWCPVNSTNCYYHTVAPGNEVDISTIYTTTSP